MINWLTAHMRAFEFQGELPKLVIPDNPKTGRACRYDPGLNPTYSADGGALRCWRRYCAAPQTVITGTLLVTKG